MSSKEANFYPIFEKIKEEVLGKDYALDFSFVNAEEIREINKTSRNKDEPTDILSFPLGDNEGEIYICKSESEKEAVKFDREPDNFLLFLFIHGCVHLKGYDHSAKMESIEKKIREKFGV